MVALCTGECGQYTLDLLNPVPGIRGFGSNETGRRAYAPSGRPIEG